MTATVTVAASYTTRRDTILPKDTDCIETALKRCCVIQIDHFDWSF